LSDTGLMVLEWTVLAKDHIELHSTNKNDIENEKAEKSKKKFVYVEVYYRKNASDFKQAAVLLRLDKKEQYFREVDIPPPDGNII